MIKADLVTGFLGSGKTTFITKYASYLMGKGLKVGILENDFGAVNVDMMLLSPLAGEKCELEMVAGGCDYDCHVRRFKTKLIQMYMSGYDRVIVEPSGVYDVDEFFDVLRDEPLENWYEIGNVFAIVDARLEDNLSEQSRYMLASQLACAGKIVMSAAQKANEDDIKNTVKIMNEVLEENKCRRRFTADECEIKNWNEFDENDFERLLKSGYRLEDHVKQQVSKENNFDSVYLMNMEIEPRELKETAEKVLSDDECGKVFRIKGFLKSEEKWYELNATRREIKLEEIENGQSVVIIIGEKLNREKIEKVFEKYNPKY